MALVELLGDGWRKVAVGIATMAAIVVLALSNLPIEVMLKLCDIILYIFGIFVGGNAVEHIKGLLIEFKKIKEQQATSALNIAVNGRGGVISAESPTPVNQ